MSPVIRVSNEVKDRLESIRRELALANRTTSTSSLGLALKNVLDTVELNTTRRQQRHGHELYEYKKEFTATGMPFTALALTKNGLEPLSADKGNEPVQIKAVGKPESRTQKMKELIDYFFQEGVRRGVYLDVSPSKHGNNKYVSYPDRFLSMDVQESRNNSLRVSVYGHPDKVLSESHLEASRLPFDLKPDRRSYTAFSIKSKSDVVAGWSIIQAGLKLRIQKYQGRESAIETDMPQPVPVNAVPSLSSLVVPTGLGGTKLIGQMLKTFNPETALIVGGYHATLANYRKVLHTSFGYPFQEYISTAQNAKSLLKGPIQHPFLTSTVEDFSLMPLLNIADEHYAGQEDPWPNISHYDVVVIDLDQLMVRLPDYLLSPMCSRHLVLRATSQSVLKRAITTLNSSEWKDLAWLEDWRRSLFMG